MNKPAKDANRLKNLRNNLIILSGEIVAIIILWLAVMNGLIDSTTFFLGLMAITAVFFTLSISVSTKPRKLDWNV